MAYLFTNAETASLPDVFSAPRFRTYLAASAHSPRDALALYQWNAEASSAFLYVIHIFEICIRNAAAAAAESHYGPRWPWDTNFELSLPQTRAPNFSPRREVVAVRNRPGNTTTGKIIADIKFAFWEGLYTSRHDGRLWDPFLKREFPHVPAGMSVATARLEIYRATETVRRLRNRIAHHEPVFTRALDADYERIMRVVGYRSDQTALWLSRTQTVMNCLARRP